MDERRGKGGLAAASRLFASAASRARDCDIQKRTELALWVLFADPRRSQQSRGACASSDDGVCRLGESSDRAVAQSFGPSRGGQRAEAQSAPSAALRPFESSLGGRRRRPPASDRRAQAPREEALRGSPRREGRTRFAPRWGRAERSPRSGDRFGASPRTCAAAVRIASRRARLAVVRFGIAPRSRPRWRAWPRLARGRRIRPANGSGEEVGAAGGRERGGEGGPEERGVKLP